MTGGKSGTSGGKVGKSGTSAESRGKSGTSVTFQHSINIFSIAVRFRIDCSRMTALLTADGVMFNFRATAVPLTFNFLTAK